MRKSLAVFIAPAASESNAGCANDVAALTAGEPSVGENSGVGFLLLSYLLLLHAIYQMSLSPPGPTLRRAVCSVSDRTTRSSTPTHTKHCWRGT